MDDPYEWLEEVEGANALAWVAERNAEAESALFTDPLFEELRSGALAVMEADDRIAMPTVNGDEVRNFWTDRTNRRGLWRRTTWDSYTAGDPEWDVLLDVDALSESEGESWVFHGASIRTPDRRRALVALSPGGSDASVTREFDMMEERFVPASEGGFERPLGKGSLTWIDDDTVYLCTDLGEGTMTPSGYPRQVRRWSRGTPLKEAPVVFECGEDDMVASVTVDTLPGAEHQVFHRRIDFYSGETFILRNDSLRSIDVPIDAEVHIRDRWVIVHLRTDWARRDCVHAAGSLIAADLEAVLAGDASFETLFEPSPTTSLAGWAPTRHHMVLNVLDDVRNRVVVCTPEGAGWRVRDQEGIAGLWSTAATPVDDDESDDIWLLGDDFITPTTLHRVSPGAAPAPVRSAPSRFDASGLSVVQHFVTSADGTRIPYFVVGPEGGSSEPGPTLLGGYGGFEVPRLPAYGGILGRSWLTAGGTYVLANIRGGGEYGPRWHRAGLRDQRPRVYEDFEAVARDLIERGVTTPSQLGCSGGSNGGLLVGNMYVRSPELWGAIVCQVPLLDMKRYHHLLAGASWMAEYGDPDDPDDWAFIQGFSPYHLVDADREYPPLLLTTSTRDDRVHPGHARKMAAKLGSYGKDVLYWENVEGGHGGAADAPQTAVLQALMYTFLRRHLMGPPAAQVV